MANLVELARQIEELAECLTGSAIEAAPGGQGTLGAVGLDLYALRSAVEAFDVEYALAVAAVSA